MGLIIALVGYSGAGKSHIASVLANKIGYRIIRYSDALGEITEPFHGDERVPFRKDGKEFQSYKHYLCYVAAKQNLINPDCFNIWVAKRILDNYQFNIVLDGLRSPFQLSQLKQATQGVGRLLIVRVQSQSQYIVSGMDTLLDDYVFPTIQNDKLSENEILDALSIIIHKGLR